MPKNWTQYETVSLAEYDTNLSAKGTGLVVAKYFRDLAPNTVVTANFEGVETVSSRFLHTAFQGVRHHILRHGPQKNPMVALTGLSPEVAEEISYIVSDPNSELRGLATADESGVSVLTTKIMISEAFETAKALSSLKGSFTATELASAIGVSNMSANNRMAVLRETGSVTRWPDPTSGGRPRYLYRSLTDKDMRAL